MQKQAPSIAKILVAVGFALSCFALMLFLWVTFGGPIPFNPSSYRFTADLPEAVQVTKEADVRIGGVNVGKVKSLELPPVEEGEAGANYTRAEIEIDPEYAPISSDAKAILRQKTLLGETYIELTTGTQTTGEDGEVVQGDSSTAQGGATDVDAIVGDAVPEPIPEGGHLGTARVLEQVQIDEIFQALDEETRNAFRVWMKNSAIAVNGRGLDLSDSFGNLGPFITDASEITETLRRQDEALSSVVSNTGAVFEALTARDQELASMIVGSNRTFGALASRDEELAETFQILPVFQRESRLTLDRLESFSRNAEPLADELIPVARDATPTLRNVRRFSPHLKRLFRELGPLVDASCGVGSTASSPCNDIKTGGVPALGATLRELRPVMASLDPFLANLNPPIRYLSAQRGTVGDFLAGPGAAIEGTLQPGGYNPAGAPGHVLRQIGYINAFVGSGGVPPPRRPCSPSRGACPGDAIAFHPTRQPYNRGNAYLGPSSDDPPGQIPPQGFQPIGNTRSNTANEVFPNWDCENVLGYQRNAGDGNLDPGAGERKAYYKGGPSDDGAGDEAEGHPAQEGPSPSTTAACTLAPNFPSFSVGFPGNTRFPQLWPDAVPAGIQVGPAAEPSGKIGKAKGAKKSGVTGGGPIDTQRSPQPDLGFNPPFSGVPGDVKQPPAATPPVEEEPPLGEAEPAAEEDEIPVFLLPLLAVLALGAIATYIFMRRRGGT
jgi:phospholipid/cholesterol/gamma-HCH transport system substrate-binding protein